MHKALSVGGFLWWIGAIAVGCVALFFVILMFVGSAQLYDYEDEDTQD
ncbi:hypothetical protein GPOL_c25790 [Gordonia polyisoprenivorans VH2]|uniref:Uncharacterized protein n=1 Tax=Gordonia polyisoprenivorans (strain DSM 44266 / VH2) TaxID=1112204 RepID=H6N4M4_GORPV|nr:hypothetical protein GPOL_c25790 [Gordonia polyisoprenivorans VH2]